NTTLEHYTRYKAAELETAVIELQNLQRNASGCTLSAVREKYKQQKVRKPSPSSLFFFKCYSLLLDLVPPLYIVQGSFDSA
ncbi:a-type cyclin, partial [Genlisea aurea]